MTMSYHAYNTIRLIDTGEYFMDIFYTQAKCDRCNGSLEGGRIMSMYNTDCICMACKRAERKRPDYKTVQEIEMTEIRNGNYNYSGPGYTEDTV